MANGDALTMDRITQLITDSSNKTLIEEVDGLRAQVYVETHRATDYVAETVNENIPCQESFDVVRSIPEFSEKINAYVNWREAAQNAMSLYVRGGRRYFAALTILCNKITLDVNDTLTNHGNVLNFNAIIARLDFVYSDKSPIHII